MRMYELLRLQLNSDANTNFLRLFDAVRQQEKLPDKLKIEIADITDRLNIKNFMMLGTTIYYQSVLGVPFRVYVPEVSLVFKLPKSFLFSKVYKYSGAFLQEDIKVIKSFVDFILSKQIVEFSIESCEANINYEIIRSDSKKGQGKISGINYFNFERNLRNKLDELWQITETSESKTVFVNKNWKNSTQSTKDYEVLVIEDNSLFANVLSKFFTKNNISSVFANNLESGFEKLKKNKFSVIIIDYIIEDEVAVKHISRLKNLYPATPLFMLSSITDPDIKLECLKEGVDLFIEKAEDPRIVVTYLEKILLRQ